MSRSVYNIFTDYYIGETHYVIGWDDKTRFYVDAEDRNIDPKLVESDAFNTAYDHAVFYHPDEDMIYAYMSLRDRRQNRLTKHRPGRFIRRVYPTMNEQQVEEFANGLKPRPILFAYTPEDIMRVYVEGRRHANSCMSHSPGDFNLASDQHPTMAYSGPDLAVAYQLNVAGEICNRAVVWLEKSIYSTCYGNSTTAFKTALQALGYHSGNLHGARMSIIPSKRHTNKILYPYIDGCSDGAYYDADENCLVIGYGQYSQRSFGQSTSGHVELVLREDYFTGEMAVDPDSYTHPADGRTVYTNSDPDVDEYGYLMLQEQEPEAYSEDGWPLALLPRLVTCCITNTRYHPSNAVRVADQWYCVDEYLKRFRRDFFTTEIHPIEQMSQLRNGSWTLSTNTDMLKEYAA